MMSQNLLFLYEDQTKSIKTEQPYDVINRITQKQNDVKRKIHHL